jgi:hypothetical protein
MQEFWLKYFIYKRIFLQGGKNMGASLAFKEKIW